MNIIKVAIADDHQMFRQLLKKHLVEFKDIDVVLEASDGKELIQLTPKWNPDVLLLDLSMPNTNGFEVLDHFKKSHQEIKIIVLSMFEEKALVKSALEKGAQVFLLKNSEISTIVQTIRKTFQGAAPKQIVRTTAGDITERQKEILFFLSKGNTAKQIAKKLFISPRTVEDHKNNLLRQFKAKNTAELIRIVSNRGILEFVQN